MDCSEDGQLKNETDATAPAFVELRSVSKRFGDSVALRDVSLSIRRGEVFAILGPSGCGKSTLLRIMAGLESPASGEMRVEGRSMTRLPPYDRPVNMMFQSYALFPHMTVEKNIAFGLEQDRLPAREIAARVDRMLELVRMTEFRGRRPATLSGGQQQRVALARSLAKEPKVLLLDEPLGALDRRLRAEMQFEIAEIIRRVRVTCILVTHDQEEAMVMADRMALLNEGRVVQSGLPAEIYEFPNSRFSAEFLGAVNIFAGRTSPSSEKLVALESPDTGGLIKAFAAEPVTAGAEVAVAVRPEKIVLNDSAHEGHHNASPAVVEDVACLGAFTTYHLRLPTGHAVTALEPNKSAPRIFRHGDAAHISWDIRDGVLLTS